jgi:hypothetical protein
MFGSNKTKFKFLEILFKFDREESGIFSDKSKITLVGFEIHPFQEYFSFPYTAHRSREATRPRAHVLCYRASVRAILLRSSL